MQMCFLAILLTAASVLAAEPEVRPLACVPFAEFRLAGASFSSSASSIHKRFGTPTRIRTIDGEDDGGKFTYHEESFPGITFTFGRDSSLDGIAVTSRRYPLPSGVRVGMTIEDVAKLLRFSLSGLKAAPTITLTPCDSIENATLMLTFEIENRQSPNARSLLRRMDLSVHYD